MKIALTKYNANYLLYSKQCMHFHPANYSPLQEAALNIFEWIHCEPDTINKLVQNTT